MLESVVEEYLAKKVKELGGETRKVGWLGRKSAPDRYVMLPGWCFWVELKRPGKDATPAQAREHTRMRRWGAEVTVMNCHKDVDAFAAAYRLRRERLDG